MSTSVARLDPRIDGWPGFPAHTHTRVPADGEQPGAELGLTPGGRVRFGAAARPELVGPNSQLTAYDNGRGGLQSVAIRAQPRRAQ